MSASTVPTELLPGSKAIDRKSDVERSLSAILAVGVAGCSRLTHRDEEATHAKA
jgi:hypothetical protein